MTKSAELIVSCPHCDHMWKARGLSAPGRCPRCGKSLIRRSGSGAGFFIGLVVVVGLVIAGRSGSSDTATSPKPDSIVSPTQPGGEQSVPGRPDTTSSDVEASASRLAPVENHDIHPTIGQSEVQPAVGTSLPSANERGADEKPETAASSPFERVFTDAEIDQMENEKRYHGDDPIVRARLGLPSRETKRLSR